MLNDRRTWLATAARQVLVVAVVWWVWGWWVFVSGAPARTSAPPASDAERPQVSTAAPSIGQGVYTPAQAERGAAIYKQSCEHCHLADLGGNPVEEAPSLVRDAFLARWRGKTIGDLFETVSRTMPADAAGSLSRRDYVEVIAYILQVNHYPAGSHELERDPGRLQQIVIDTLAQGNAR
jgi:cytochrome c